MADHRGDEGEAAIDRLYALPLGEFTGARDELSRRLRRNGHRDAAAGIKRLRKPSVSAWALNQVRRNNPRQTDELIDAGLRLREAQERLLAGGGREQLQRAAADERRLVGELARHAERELVAAGRTISSTVQEKLRATLHAVASDPEAREDLAAGRLVRDHEASGLGPVVETEGRSDGSDSGERPQEPPAGAAGAIEPRVSRLEARLARARDRQHELDEERAEAARRLREARREATRAATELERAEAAEERAAERAEAGGEAIVELERELGELVSARGA